MSFHLKEVACLNKNKPERKCFFGRTIQLGRIAGNFLFVGKMPSANHTDKQSLPLLVKELLRDKYTVPLRELNLMIIRSSRRTLSKDEAYVRETSRQKQEFMIGCGVLNKMISLGMPVSSKIV